jgi:hypothetical protein
MNSFDIIINEMIGEISKGKKSMLGSGIIVDKEKMLQLVANLKASLPEVVQRSYSVLGESDKIIAESIDRANATVQDAERRAAFLIQNSEIVKRSEYEADMIIKEAYDKVGEIEHDSKRRIDGLLAETEKALAEQLQVVRNNREVLKGELLKN